MYFNGPNSWLRTQNKRSVLCQRRRQQVFVILLHIYCKKIFVTTSEVIWTKGALTQQHQQSIVAASRSYQASQWFNLEMKIIRHILNLASERELLGWSGFRSTVNWWATKRPFWSLVPNTALESPKFPTIRSWPWQYKGKALNCQHKVFWSNTIPIFL